MSILDLKHSNVDINRAVDSLADFETLLPDNEKPVSLKSREFFIAGYTEALLNNDYVITSFSDEDFTSQGFKKEQFSNESLETMLKAFTYFYLTLQKNLKKDLAKEVIRKEAADLKLKPQL